MELRKETMSSNCRMSAAWGRILAALLVLLAPTSIWAARKDKIAQDLDLESKGSAMVDVIVQYRHAPGSGNQAKAQKHGAVIKSNLDLIKGCAMSVPADQLLALLDEDSDISYVSPDRDLQSTSYTDAFTAISGDLARAAGWSGKGVVVAVIDSGIGKANDFNNASGKTRIVYSQNFTQDKNADDYYGHGTHVAGIIAGAGQDSTCSTCFLTYYGLAPQVNLVNLKALDANGNGKDSSVISAIQAAINLRSKYNIRIINLSLGRGIYESYTVDPLTQAVEQAWKAGIVVVVSAGNYGRDNSNDNGGYGTITAPGNDPYVITAGAMKTMGTQSSADDVIATYSSKGPTFLDHVVKPDIVAPGNGIVSVLGPSASLENNYPSTLLPFTTYIVMPDYGLFSSSYFTLSGTSMAAPMVSGAAALLLEQNPNLTPDQVKARLMKSANKNLVLYSSYTDPSTGVTYNEQSDIFTIGAGYLDVNAALQNTDLATATSGSAKSPTAAYDPSTGQVYLVSDSSVVWGNSIVWGTSLVWGTSVVWGNDAAAQSVVWGNSVVLGQ
jgi:serine protease AprX